MSLAFVHGLDLDGINALRKGLEVVHVVEINPHAALLPQKPA
jgi:hypothetical protein